MRRICHFDLQEKLNTKIDTTTHAHYSLFHSVLLFQAQYITRTRHRNHVLCFFYTFFIQSKCQFFAALF